MLYLSEKNMKKTILSLLTFSVMGIFRAQKADSIAMQNIDEVVITGQYNPQSINKSIYKVEVIGASQIKNMGATTVADVLSQNLNIMIVSDTANGNAYANILGLGGAYTKVLIDNIPVVNDEGLGNLIDLSKISTDNIEKIEIVRGSMGVEYGSNAIAGVINIITKKNFHKKFTANFTLQEESVSSGYNWYQKGKGRHIQSLNLNYKFSDKLQIGFDINHNDFKGFDGDKKGYRFFDETLNGLRGYQWQPKNQLNANAYLRYSNGPTTLFYKTNLLSEEINYRTPITQQILLHGGERTFVAHDRDFTTRRWLHQFNINTNINKIKYLGDFSYQKQVKKRQNYIYDIPNAYEQSREEALTYYDINTMYSRGVFSNFMDSRKFDFQVGYELDRTQGFADASTGLFSGNNVKRTIFNYNNMLSAEWSVTDKLHLRSGARLSLSDRFSKQVTYSFVAKYIFSPRFDIRISSGSANRFPTYDELFTYMVDSNHDIRGNENLTPEKGYTIALFADYKSYRENNNFQLNFSATYLNVKNRIELTYLDILSRKMKYMNLDDYKTILFNAEMKTNFNHFGIHSGVSLVGISQNLNAVSNQSPHKFFFTPEFNLTANYNLRKTNTLFTLNYKYSGPVQKYRLDGMDSQGNGVFGLGKMDGFNMLNATITQKVFKKLEIAIGAKNIFDIKDINDTTSAPSGHSSASTINLFYGRSYFLRLLYKF